MEEIGCKTCNSTYQETMNCIFCDGESHWTQVEFIFPLAFAVTL